MGARARAAAVRVLLGLVELRLSARVFFQRFKVVGADCSAEASPRTDPVANWAWPINVDRDLPYADFLASFEAYKVGVTGL